MIIVNLTPHKLNLCKKNGKTLMTVEPSGKIARIPTVRKERTPIEVLGIEIPVCETTTGKIEGLPDPETETIYIVSDEVQATVPDRSDVYKTGSILYGEHGRIGVVGLDRNV